MNADSVYESLREILDEKLSNIYKKMEADKKDVVATMRECQLARDKFHQEQVPQYNHLLCKDRKRESLYEKVKVGVLTAVSVAVILGGYKVIVTLHQILNILAMHKSAG